MYTTEIHGNPLPQRICSFHRTRNDTTEQLWHTHYKDGNRRRKRNASLSERVCLPCFTKIRKKNEGFSLIAATLNVVNSKFVPESEIEESVIAPRMNRTLPSSVTTSDRRSGQRNITKSKENQKEEAEQGNLSESSQAVR